MGAIHVHEFMTLDGVVDAPMWTFEYGLDDKMGEVEPRRRRSARAIPGARCALLRGPAPGWPTQNRPEGGAWA